MTSFIIVKMPRQRVSPEKMVEKVKELSIFNSDGEFKIGTLPDSLRVSNGSTYFVFGYEYLHEYQTLKGPATVTAFREVKVALVGEGFVAIENIEEEGLERVSRVLERNFVPDIVLNTIPFEERILRSIIEKNLGVFEIDHTPVRRGLENVDRIRYTGRDVTRSQIYEEYGDQPIERIKVRLGEIPEGVRVTFNKRGSITIVRRSEPDELTAVLKVVVDRVIAPYMVEVLYQKRLG